MAKVAPSSLAGKEILITRAAEQSESLVRELEARGAKAFVHPLIAFEPPGDFAPLDNALRDLAKFDWLLFTSQNGVRAVVDRAQSLGLRLSDAAKTLRIAAVGPATAEVISTAGLRVAYVAEKHQGLALAEELAAELKGKRVFLPRSDLASADLPDALRRFGAHVAEVVAYRTCSTSEPDSLSASSFLSAHPRALLFFSPSAVRAFLAQEQGRELLTSISLNSDRIAVVAIGPVTATALREAGIRNIVQAPNPTVPAVVEALEQFFSSTEPEPRSL